MGALSIEVGEEPDVVEEAAAAFLELLLTGAAILLASARR